MTFFAAPTLQRPIRPLLDLRGRMPPRQHSGEGPCSGRRDWLALTACAAAPPNSRGDGLLHRLASLGDDESAQSPSYKIPYQTQITKPRRGPTGKARRCAEYVVLSSMPPNRPHCSVIAGVRSATQKQVTGHCNPRYHCGSAPAQNAMPAHHARRSYIACLPVLLRGSLAPPARGFQLTDDMSARDVTRGRVPR